ncbi:TonB-dependent receptor [Sanyastnella coralliicola]|uniref:TonB-dependent receptor n=1 Tax=Sanyastnella coralliicola TaxID=3069118 RepID=UPI0027B8AD60|nr:TonB-dependent receptor [Longitalea sp. SCSIO 12813]
MQRLSKIFLILPLIFLALSTQGQDLPDSVRFDGKEVKLNRALLDLRKEFNLPLAYDNRQLRNYRVTGTGEWMSPEALLRQWLIPIGFTYELIYGTFVIYPQNERLAQNKPTRFEISVFGRVMDLDNGEPLPYATVAEEGTSNANNSNLQGYFTLNNVTADTVVLVCTYVGYDPFRLQLTPSTDLENVEIYLSRSRALLPTAQVTTYRQGSTIKVERPSLTLVDGELANELPSIGEPDIVRTIQLLPGVSGALENSAFIHVRGGAGDENLVTYDGFTIYYLDHFYGLFSAFNTNSIQSVRLHKGVFSPKFGGRGSSVLEITGRTGNKNKPVIKTDLNLLSAAAHIESPILADRATLMLSARRSFTDVVFSPAYQELFNGVFNNSVLPGANDEVNAFTNESSPDFHFYDITGKLALEVGERGDLSFSLYSGRDRLSIAYSDSTTDGRFFVGYNDRSEWGNLGYGAKWTNQWNAQHFSSVTFGRSVFSSELFGFDSRENLLIGTTDTLFFDRDTRIADGTLRLDHEISLPGHLINMGAELTAINVSNSQLASNGENDSDTAAASIAAVYVGDQWKLNERFFFEAGFRAVYFDRNRSLYPEPRFLMDFKATPSLTLHVGAGANHQFIRNVRRQDLFLNTSDEWRLAGESRIPVLQTEQLTAGFSITKGLFSFSADAWYKTASGVTEDALRFTSLPAGTFEQNLLNGDGKSRGIELLARKELGVHSGWIAYTLSSTENTFNELQGDQIPAWYDRSHELKTVYQFRPGRFRVNAVFVYATGLPYTPAAGVYDITLINGETEQLLAFAEIHSGRLPDYHRLDLSGFYDFTLGEGNASIGFSLYNVYNRTNVRNRYYYLLGTQEESIEVALRDQLFLGTVPSIQFSFEW